MYYRLWQHCTVDCKLKVSNLMDCFYSRCFYISTYFRLNEGTKDVTRLFQNVLSLGYFTRQICLRKTNLRFHGRQISMQFAPIEFFTMSFHREKESHGEIGIYESSGICNKNITCHIYFNFQQVKNSLSMKTYCRTKFRKRLFFYV